MARAIFTKGFVKAKTAKGRTAIKGRIESSKTRMDFEGSVNDKFSGDLMMFITLLCNCDTDPQKSFDESFGRTNEQRNQS